MGDQIAILASPGKVVANGSPVSLKRDLGQGYSVQVTTSPGYRPVDASHGLLSRVLAIVPAAYEMSTSPTQCCYHLRTRDPDVMQRVLELLDSEIQDDKLVSYAIFGTTIEEIFLDLMSKHDHVASDLDEEVIPMTAATPAAAALADLPMGRAISPLQQAFTIFHKRLLITRRSWLTWALTILVAVCGSCIPLIFMSKEWPSCNMEYIYPRMVPLYLPNFLRYYSQYFSVLPLNIGLQSPPGILQTLGPSTNILKFTSTPDNTTFTTNINSNYKNFLFGGISIDNTTGASLVAWEATPPGFTGLSALNLATNVLFNRALNMSGLTTDAPRLIQANYQRFPFLVDLGIVGSLRWMFYFGAAMVSLRHSLACCNLPEYDLHLRLFIPHFFPCMSLESVDRRSRPCNFRMD
jgi:ATP-binding cassette subfamily A (ABC1) protein 3